MQINYALAAILGMIATGAVASPVPEANPNAEPEAVEARAEQGKQFLGHRPFRRPGFNQFEDNDFLDILKRDPEALEARAEQGKQHFGWPCGWRGCGRGRWNHFDDDDLFDDDVDFFEDNDFLDVLKRDESGIQARAEQAEQAKQGEQNFYPSGRRWRNDWRGWNNDDDFRRPFPINPYPYNPNRNRNWYPRYRNNWNPRWNRPQWNPNWVY